MRPMLMTTLQRLASDRAGNVALMTALCAFPLLGMMGLVIDFTTSLSVKSKLDAATDAAVIAGLTKAQTVFHNEASTVADPTADAVAQGTAQAQAAFKANVSATSFSSMPTPTITITRSGLTLSASGTYAAKAQHNFGSLFGVATGSVAGKSAASVTLPSYINFYLLLDNSPSMGIAATNADITKMQTLTGGCAFACHQHTNDAQGHVTGDNTADNYHIAKANGVQTRIDLMRQATQNLTATATAQEAYPQQYGMAIYTFSDTFQQIAGMATDLNAVNTQASAIDLAYSYVNQRDTQTSFDTAFNYMNTIIPTPGDGSAPTKPQEFLFLVTDGAADQPISIASGSGDTADLWSNGTSAAPVNTQPNVYSGRGGNVSTTRLISAIDPTMCSTLKAKGVVISILYTTYLPIPTNGFYNSWVAPISNGIYSNLQSCASSGMFFPINANQDINTAMQAMFLSAVARSHLTQ